jgi:hypothetical protein
VAGGCSLALPGRSADGDVDDAVAGAGAGAAAAAPAAAALASSPPASVPVADLGKGSMLESVG